MEVVRTAWSNVRDDVREDAMRTLQCCGFDNDDYMNTWQDRGNNNVSFYLFFLLKTDYLKEGTAGWCKREGIPLPKDNQHNFDYKYCKTKVLSLSNLY